MEAAEEHLRALGYKQFRVRYHGELARIEIAREELAAGITLDQMDRITAAFRAVGFQYVTLDTAGYRSGSMNELLTQIETAGITMERDSLLKLLAQVQQGTLTPGRRCRRARQPAL